MPDSVIRRSDAASASPAAGQTGARRARGTTLRRQLFAWLSGPLLILWIISSVIDYDIANRFVNLAYDRSLLETAVDIGRQVKVVNGRIYVDLPEIALQMLQSRESGRLYYLVTGPDGQYITGQRDLPHPDEPVSGRIAYYDDYYQNRPVRIVAAVVPVQTGRLVTVLVAENRAARNEFARQIMLRMVLPQVLLILVAGSLLYYAVGRGLSPLSNLRREIESRSHRDLSALSEDQAPAEVRPLIQAMNELLQRLSATLAAQQRFIADAAHQLRTPIAGIKTQTELALRQTPPAGAAQETLRQLHTATEQTTRLVNQLLALARAEPGADRLATLERLDIAELARDVTKEWVPRAIERGIDLGYEGPESLFADGNAFLLREMLNNLIDNAVRYTQRGGQVTVRAATQEEAPQLLVEDNGPGIPPEERERVFERFYRVLGTGVEGCGLGLAIVAEIAQRHNAELTLAAGPGGTGTIVSVRFPRITQLRPALR